tara:strand:- start:989 stop:1597 length:609 start_codon:yes stop_codon:yes gene_type:complete
MKGMIIDVYHNPQYRTCTNGPSRTHDSILVVGDGVPEIFDAFTAEGEQKRPVFILSESVPGYPTLVPVDTCEGTDGQGYWVMDGGNFATSCDSRWNELIRSRTGGRGAPVVPIHDRSEDQTSMRLLTGRFPAEFSQKAAEKGETASTQTPHRGEPESGKTYLLIGKRDQPSIANGDNWQDAEIKEPDPKVTPLPELDRYFQI